MGEYETGAGQDRGESDEHLWGGAHLGVLLEDGVVDATAAAFPALIPSGPSLTRQAQWALMGLLSGKEIKFKKCYPCTFWGLIYNSGGTVEQ